MIIGENLSENKIAPNREILEKSKYFIDKNEITLMNESIIRNKPWRLWFQRAWMLKITEFASVGF